MVHTIAAHVPNLLPNWHFFRPAGRLIWATLVLVAAIAVILWMCSKPKPVEPATWAQSMLGAVVTFGLMLLAYGTIPHEWLTFGNSYLHLGESSFLVRSGQQIAGPIHFLNFSINKRAMLDTVAALMYVVLLTLNVFLFVKWQKRPVAKPVEAATSESAASESTKDVGTSAYGRPVTAKV